MDDKPLELIDIPATLEKVAEQNEKILEDAWWQLLFISNSLDMMEHRDMKEEKAMLINALKSTIKKHGGTDDGKEA